MLEQDDSDNNIPNENEVFIDVNEGKIDNESYLSEATIDYLSNVVFKIILNKKESEKKSKEIKKQNKEEGKKNEEIKENEDSLKKEENEKKEKKSTGFLMKLKIENIYYYFIITCIHCLKGKDETDIPDVIFLYYGKKQQKFKIRLDQRKRFIKCYDELDIAVIQVFNSDKIAKPKYFLEPGLKDGNYVGENIFLVGYRGNEAQKTYFKGKILEIKDKQYRYDLETSGGCSGSPLINAEKWIIGVHKGHLSRKEKIKASFFIYPVIEDLLSEERKREIINLSIKDKLAKRNIFTFLFLLIFFLISLLTIILIFSIQKKLKKCYGDNLFINHGILKDIYYCYGKEYFENGNIKFNGTLENGEYNGYGIIYYDNGKIKYKGFLKNGKYNGYGFLFYENGEIQYDGEWLDNMKNGYGKLYYKNGYKKYEGYWKNDKEDGYGTKYFLSEDSFLENHDICEDFSPGNEDHAISFQKRYYINKKDHRCYKGQWHNGTKTGKGNYYYFNGAVKYSGEWKNNKKHGHGELRDRNERLIYYGDFVENKMHGRGDYYTKDSLYSGNFENDAYNGHGTLENKKEKYKIIGFFVNGKLNGEASMELLDLRKFLFEGFFLNGIAHGKFKFFSDEKEIYANFENGKRKLKILEKHTYDFQEESDFLKEIFNKYSIFKSFQL